MKIIAAKIPDVKIIVPKIFNDKRGFFVETYNKNRYTELGIDIDFVQDNLSLTKEKGTVRGLHFQIPPFEQSKLIFVVKGSIFDVSVDIRKGSPTYGEYVGTVLDSENGKQIVVPAGFAHGFVSLEDETRVSYKVSNDYSPNHELGISWEDPDIGINWPDTGSEFTFSDKDSHLPRFSDLSDYFDFS